MAEEYAHTLIAKPKGFAPSASQVQKFLSFLVAQGVVPENPVIVLRILTGKIRQFPNMSAAMSQRLGVELKDQKKFQSLDGIVGVAETLQDYELNVAAMGRPKLPPLPIIFNEPYHVGVTCRVYSKCRSTSDPHEKSMDGEETICYGKICSESQKDGFFTSPQSGESFNVPDAGCARFWIEFELGKFLFPEVTPKNLELLNPFIVTEAERTFGIGFVQGCHW